MQYRNLVVLFALVLFRAQPVQANSIQITATSSSSPGMSTGNVRLDLQIEDNGGVPDCGAFVIMRKPIFPCGSPLEIQCIIRQTGTRTLQFFDTVSANTSYRYEVVGYSTPYPGVPLCSGPSSPSEFQRSFDPNGFGFPIQVFTTVGPDPTPIAQGRLTQPVDACHLFGLQNCADGCNAVMGGDGDAATPYIDTDVDVWLYGTIEYCCNSCTWVLTATQVVPHGCGPVAVASQPWSQVKALYR